MAAKKPITPLKAAIYAVGALVAVAALNEGHDAITLAIIVALTWLAGEIFRSKDKGYEKEMSKIGRMRSGGGLFGRKGQSHGTADFADYSDLKKEGLLQKEGFLLGKFNDEFVRYSKPGHIITFAPTRSGKGVGHVIPNLLTHPGSVVVNDIKGENLAVSSRTRRGFGEVFAFAPFANESCHYNPIDFIRIGTPDELDDVALIADMLIVEDKNSGDPFWTREAKNLFTCLILHVATSRPPVLRNLGEVRYLIMQSKTDFDFTVKEMLKSPNSHVRKMAASISATEAKVMASVLSTAKSQTAVWDSPRLNAITGRSDFKMEDLKQKIMSLYIIIPPEYLDVYGPLLRLLNGLAIAAMTRTQGKPQKPVLFLIDEFPTLNYMKPVESGIGYLAGYGVVLWMFIQDLSQLKAIYPKWESFLSNCGVRMAFGTNDVETAKVLSDMLGTTTIQTRSSGTSREAGLKLAGGSISKNYSESARQLMTPDEVMRMPFDSQLIFIQGFKPVVAEKIRYFDDEAFKGLFDKWNG